MSDDDSPPRPGFPYDGVPVQAAPLIGAARGDALGAGVEGGQALERGLSERPDDVGVQFLPYSPFGFEPGELTDDTEMALAALVESKGPTALDSEAAAEAFMLGRFERYRAWYVSSPPDVGGATSDALSLADVDGGWDSWRGGDSAGNGSLMRATAAYVEGYRGRDLIRAAALDSTVTHPDPSCVASCVFYVATIERAMELDDPAGFPDAVRAGIEALLATPSEVAKPGDEYDPPFFRTFDERWSAARLEVIQRIEPAMRGEYVDCTRAHWTDWPTGYVLDSIGQAVWAAAHGSTAAECTRLSVLHGGRDADTIGAIAGGLIGARFGHRAFRDWNWDLIDKLRLGHSWPGGPAEPDFMATLYRVFDSDLRRRS